MAPKKYMYNYRACKCCIKRTNSIFELSDKAPICIKSFIIQGSQRSGKIWKSGNYQGIY